MNKSLLAGVIFTVLIVIGLVTYFYFSRVEIKSKPGIEAIPEDASFIFEIPDIQTAWSDLYNNKLWKDLVGNERIRQLNYTISYFDSVLLEDVELRRNLRNHKTYISFHPVASGQTQMLFVVEVENTISNESLTKWINNNFEGHTSNKRVFNKQNIYETINSEKDPVFHHSIKDNLLIASTDGGLVEDAIRRLNTKGTQHFHDLEILREYAGGNSSINIYLNFNAIGNYFNQHLDPHYNSWFNFFPQVASWTSLETKITEETVQLNGWTHTGDSIFNYLDLFKNQQPQEINAFKILPKNTSFFMHFGISNYMKFNTDFNEYITDNKLSASYNSFADSLRNIYSIDIQANLSPLIGKEAILYLNEAAGSDPYKGLTAIIQTENLPAAKANLALIYKSVQNRINSDSSVIYYKNYVLNYLPLGNFLKLIFGQAFSEINSPYYTLIDNYIVFANDQSSIRQLIDSYSSNQSLMSDSRFAEYSQSLSSSSNLMLFINTAKTLQHPLKFASADFISTLNNHQYYFKKFEFISVQFSNTNNRFFYTDVHFKYNPVFTEETRLIWNTALDSTVSRQPEMVLNTFKNENCILVQDDGNKLYMISNSGEILWKRELNGVIMGRIHQVDILKNNSIQYLFNTKNQVYMIDGNGRAVFNFPIRISSSATTGLSLFDINNSKDYSFFISSDNSRIFAYSGSGRPLNGWNPKSSPEPIVSEIQSLRKDGKTYFYGTGKSGKLYVFGKDGQNISINQEGAAASNSAYSYFSKDTSAGTFYNIDTSGILMMIHFTDSTLLNSGPKLLPGAYYFKSIDLDQDLQPEFITADIHSVHIYSLNGSQTAVINFEDSISFDLIQDKGGNTLIAVANPKENKVYMYYPGGSLYQSFPLKGSTLFSLSDFFNDNSKHLATGSTDKNIYLYKVK